MLPTRPPLLQSIALVQKGKELLEEDSFLILRVRQYVFHYLLVHWVTDDVGLKMLYEDRF
jgi:hypothetical protein